MYNEEKIQNFKNKYKTLDQKKNFLLIEENPFLFAKEFLLFTAQKQHSVSFLFDTLIDIENLYKKDSLNGIYRLAFFLEELSSL